MKKAKCMIVAVMTLLLLFTQSVAGMATAAVADPPGGEYAPISPEKEEVVYVLLDASGAAKEFYVVNSFETGTGGRITDYGAYSEVQNLSNALPIGQNGDALTLDTDAGKFYYQGLLSSAELPWNISIRYYLDGVELQAKALAGRSGKLEIALSITENMAATGRFYEGCALQLSVTLDTGLAENIVAEGATVANAGANKQLAYTVLPGSGLSAHIYADVQDFEMERISINGMKMKLDISVDTSEFTDGIDELKDGIGKLNDGTWELSDGVGSLYDAARKMANGVSEYADGVSTFDDGLGEAVDGVIELGGGIVELADGADELGDGLAELADGGYDIYVGSGGIHGGLYQIVASIDAGTGSGTEMEELLQGSAAVNAGITGIAGGIAALDDGLKSMDAASLAAANAQTAVSLAAVAGDDPQLLAVVALLQQNAQVYGGIEYARSAAMDGDEGLRAGSAALAAQYTQLDQGIQGIPSMIGASMDQLKSGLSTFAANYGDFHEGLFKYVDGVKQTSDGFREFQEGIEELSDGVNELADGFIELKDGSRELRSGAGELADGMDEFRDGIRGLRDGTTELKDGTQEFVDEMDTFDTTEMIDEMLAELSGNDVPLTSFASEKNTNIASVQFVMVTEAIEKEAPAQEAAEEAPVPTLWDRLKALFQ